MSTVMKFGGGCLRDGRSIAQACAIISAQKRVVVVVSAISGVTELLHLRHRASQAPRAGTFPPSSRP